MATLANEEKPKVCPLMRMAWAFLPDDKTPQECVRDGCGWWVDTGYEYAPSCALKKIAMDLYRMAKR